MSTLTKLEIRNFLTAKKGYIKKAPINVAKALWKRSDKHRLPKTKEELQKELVQIGEVLSTMRAAKEIKKEESDSSIIDLYDKIVAEKNKPKRRLFFDIEVSANIVFSWNVGHKITIPYENIIRERAIICVCYKWEGDDKVYSIEWDNGDDKKLLERFTKIIDSADEVITQNGDNFDIKWLRTRCLYHDIDISPKFNSIDTLKMARNGFRMNSNRLDYMGQYLGEGQKIKTDHTLWRDITLNNDKAALTRMVDYCKGDVVLLERIYQKLQKFVPTKKFKYKKS